MGLRSLKTWFGFLGFLLFVPAFASANLEAETSPPGVTPASAWVGMDESCPLFEREWWNPGDERAIAIRGACGVPEHAVAVMLEVRSLSLEGSLPSVKVWPGDGAEPRRGLLEAESGVVGSERQATVVVNLCASLPCDDLRIRGGGATGYLDARVLGYFEPLSVSLSDAEGFIQMGGSTLVGSQEEYLLEPQATESDINNFFGIGAGASITTGRWNNFFGAYAGGDTTTGFANSFFGDEAGFFNTIGAQNSFFGAQSGFSNTTGTLNSFFGLQSGFSNTTGTLNSFFGLQSGVSNTEGGDNSFFGAVAGAFNTTGSDNSFFGRDSGYFNTSGFGNSFFGKKSGLNNTTGLNNTVAGFEAGLSNTVESGNTFLGAFSNGIAGITNSAALGHRAQVGKSNSLVLGSIAGENGATTSVNVGLGVSAPERQLHIRGPNAQIRIDRPVDATSFQLVRTTSGGDVLKSFVFGVLASGPDNGSFFIRDNAQSTTGATDRVRMQINNAGNTTFQGTVSAVGFNSTSSARFKTDVTTLSDADASLKQLRGVRFNWKENGGSSLGLIAEEVAEVFPELVQFDEATGAAAAVNYAALVAVLIEGYKEQDGQLAKKALDMAAYRARFAELEQRQIMQMEQLAALRGELAELANLRSQLAEIERLFALKGHVFAQR